MRTFNYVKAPYFFEAPLHGIYSGVSEEGHIVICPFTERMVIPTEHIISEEEDGSVKHSITGKDGLVRTVHGALHLDPDELRNLIGYLEEALNQFEESK